MKVRLLIIATLISCLFFTQKVSAQSVYTEDFGTSTTVALPYVFGTNPTGAASKDANISTNPSWTQSNTSANFAGVAGGSMSATIAATGGTNIVTCTFNVGAGFQLTPASLTYNYRISGTGAQKMDSSISGTTGASSSITQVTTTRSGAFVGATTSAFNSPNALTGTITLVVTFSSTTATNSTVRLDNVILNGTVTSTGPAPEINVTGNGNTILTGDVTPTTTDFTDFGNVNLGSSVADSFVVQNTGTLNLTVSSVVISGANSADFAVTTSPVGTIASAGNSGLAITFTPSALGLRNATVTINNNDSNEAAYTFAIVGNGTCVPPANPAGAITVSANPSCGPATLSYPAGSYWQTTAGGTSTASPTSGTYPVSVTGTTVYVRNFNGTCWSTGAINSGAITINTPVAITTQPVASTIFSGSNTTFSVVATGTGLSYQWQVDTGSGFANLTNVAPYSNVTTATMNITAATVGMNGYLYRCVVSGAAPCASVTSSSALLTVTIYVPVGTVFNPGELMFVGYDAQYLGSGQHDEYLIATMVDILPGTQFTVVNSRYEAGAAANVRTDKWGGGGDFAEEAPYQAILTYNGVTIPAGSVLRFRTDASINWFGDVAKIIGTTITTITGDFSGTVLGGTLISPNVSTSGSDQMYLIQGNFVSDGTIDLNQANYYLNGTLLHGITNRAAWVQLINSCNGDSTGGNTRESRLPSALTCFNVEATGTNNESGFYENDKQHGTATIRQIVNAVADVTNNWTLSTGRYNFNPSNSLATSAGKTYLIGVSNSAGQWVGDVDTNWFNCANWEGLAVPKISTDVTVNAAAVNFAAVSYTAPYSNEYNDIAVCNNLTITGSKVEIIASVNNKLEVYGDLLIDSPAGALDMDDSTIAADGQLYLFGNWTNNMGNVAFSEGNGTVYFTGTSPQIINNVTPEGTETFHHLVLNNDFTTSVSNDIIANGNLTVGAGKILVVSPNDYAQVTDNVTNNGIFNILNSGSLVQINDAGVNTGNNISMKRTASQRLYDYIYWSSPVANFPVTSVSPTTSPSYIYKWETLAVNANGGQGNWINTGENMALGKGYIVRGASAFNNTTATSWTADFVGIPNNGIVPVTLSRGTNLPSVSVFDDNWSLIGNPYPSAIDADSFINRFGNPAFPAEYKDIEGSVRIWTHNTLPASIASPFYQNFVLNYTPNDYITYNSLGSQTGPATFNGKIAAGQSFLVLRNDGATDATTLNFDNALRSKAYNNSQFFRQSNVSNTSNDGIEKHRIWIDLVSPTNAATRTLVGYVEGATLAKDNTFDAFTDYKNATNFYSLIGAQPVIIQGRPTPFDVNDQVPMGIKTPTNGTYTIAIAAADGLFAGKVQKIYIEDKLLGTINDITVSPYQFTATQGITNNRFVLRYTNQALSNADYDLANNAVTVFASTAGININSTTESIKGYTVYNVLGQTLAEKNNVNANQSVVNTIAKNNQALIVKIVLTNGQAIIKKVIF